MTRVEQIKKFIHFDRNAVPGTIAFTIDGFAVKDKWKKIFVVYNGNNSFANIKFPKGKWKILADASNVSGAGIGVPLTGTAAVPPTSGMILSQ